MALLGMLFAGAGIDPKARDAKHLASLLAHSARLVRGIVQDRLSELNGPGHENNALIQVREVFKKELYSHPEAGGYSNDDFNQLFSAAFAQTLAFGLLLAREAASGPLTKEDAWKHMPGEHPLMQTTLRVLSQHEVAEDVGIGFDVICDTVNCLDPETLAIGADGRDPILYFYEDFLETFDPEARQRYGVYYTPLEVVRYMTGALDRALRDFLGMDGLRDDKVTLLDPATGTGTFLLGIAERVWQTASAEVGEGGAALELAGLAGRMFGFELLVGPYAVAHYRLHHTLKRTDGADIEFPRMGIYLADTLARPDLKQEPSLAGFIAKGITDEREEANRIKSEQAILAIIGNPPYRRLKEGENQTLVGDWMDGIWKDLKTPVSDAGKGGQLNTFPELSVAFWRWSIWKMFEAPNAPKRGVIAFITNRKFLTGWPYAGLRQMMRQRFDRIEIIDLRGDVRRGERGDVDADQGVFNIQVGTAIVLAIADGSQGENDLAHVSYLDAWEAGKFKKAQKLEWLNDAAVDGALDAGVPVVRGPLDDFRPAPFQNGEWVSLKECFGFAISGVQTKRDSFVISPRSEILKGRIEALQTLSLEEATQLFSPNETNTLADAKSYPFDAAAVQAIAYRPMDQRYLYNHQRFVDRRRPELQAVFGANNICFYAMPAGTGAGPAVWCHGLLPDYHAFRGSYGGYAFPLHDRRPTVNATNLNQELLLSFGAAIGLAVTPEDVFDMILALLSAPSYAQNFAEDLEDVFPHIPFPADCDLYEQAVRLGRQIRAVETFAPRTAKPRADFFQLTDQPKGTLATVTWADGEITLCADGTGRVILIPEAIWTFSVSGYRVFPRWLEGRVGLLVDNVLFKEMRDIAERIADLLELFEQADKVLEQTLGDSVTRLALGFIPQEMQLTELETEDD